MKITSGHKSVRRESTAPSEGQTIDGWDTTHTEMDRNKKSAGVSPGGRTLTQKQWTHTHTHTCTNIQPHTDQEMTRQSRPTTETQPSPQREITDPVRLCPDHKPSHVSVLSLHVCLSVRVCAPD